MEKWVYDSRSTIMRPNTMNRFGVVLDDFGFESMLQKLVDDFISPISQCTCVCRFCVLLEKFILYSHGFGFGLYVSSVSGSLWNRFGFSPWLYC